MPADLTDWVECPRCHHHNPRGVSCQTPACVVRAHREAEHAIPATLSESATYEPAKIERGRQGLQQHVSDWLAQNHYESLHLSWKAREKTGWPDNTFAVAGQAVAIELKAGNKQPTAEQLRMHDRLRANGWLVFVARSLEQVRDIVRGVEAKQQESANASK